MTWYVKLISRYDPKCSLNPTCLNPSNATKISATAVGRVRRVCLYIQRSNSDPSISDQTLCRAYFRAISLHLSRAEKIINTICTIESRKPTTTGVQYKLSFNLTHEHTINCCDWQAINLRNQWIPIHELCCDPNSQRQVPNL